MKRILLIATAILIFGKANCQETNPITPSKTKEKSIEENTRFMILAGFNYANLTSFEGTALVNYHAGVAAEFFVAENFSIQPELTYSIQGTKVANGSFYLNYINLPVLAKYYVTKPLSIIAGPQVGFLTSAKAKGIGGGTADVSSLIKSIDFGLKFGLGYNIDRNAMVQLTYGLGLTQIQEQLAEDEPKSKNSVFQFTVGYKF